MNLPPPAEVKRYLLARTLLETGIRTFVETGTFYGDTVAAIRPYVDCAFTIEADEPLWKNAVNRFIRDDDVETLLGDSAAVLAEVLPRVPRPALFWLDAHWMGPERRDPNFGLPGGETAPMTRAASGDTPLATELRLLLDRGCAEDIIVIDDARYCGFVPSYPSVGEVAAMVGPIFRRFDVVLDAIWITPPTYRAPTAGIRYGDNGEWGCPLVPGMSREWLGAQAGEVKP